MKMNNLSEREEEAKEEDDDEEELICIYMITVEWFAFLKMSRVCDYSQ